MQCDKLILILKNKIKGHANVKYKYENNLLITNLVGKLTK